MNKSSKDGIAIQSNFKFDSFSAGLPRVDVKESIDDSIIAPRTLDRYKNAASRQASLIKEIGLYSENTFCGKLDLNNKAKNLESNKLITLVFVFIYTNILQILMISYHIYRVILAIKAFNQRQDNCFPFKYNVLLGKLSTFAIYIFGFYTVRNKSTYSILSSSFKPITMTKFVILSFCTCIPYVSGIVLSLEDSKFFLHGETKLFDFIVEVSDILRYVPSCAIVLLLFGFLDTFSFKFYPKSRRSVTIQDKNKNNNCYNYIDDNNINHDENGDDFNDHTINNYEYDSDPNFSYGTFHHDHHGYTIDHDQNITKHTITETQDSDGVRLSQVSQLTSIHDDDIQEVRDQNNNKVEAANINDNDINNVDNVQLPAETVETAETPLMSNDKHDKNVINSGFKVTVKTDVNNYNGDIFNQQTPQRIDTDKRINSATVTRSTTDDANISNYNYGRLQHRHGNYNSKQVAGVSTGVVGVAGAVGVTGVGGNHNTVRSRIEMERRNKNLTVVRLKNYNHYYFMKRFYLVTHNYHEIIKKFEVFIAVFFMVILVLWITLVVSLILDFKSGHCQFSALYYTHYTCETIFYCVLFLLIIYKLHRNHMNIVRYKANFNTKIAITDDRNAIQKLLILQFLQEIIHRKSPFRVFGIDPSTQTIFLTTTSLLFPIVTIVLRYYFDTL